MHKSCFIVFMVRRDRAGHYLSISDLLPIQKYYNDLVSCIRVDRTHFSKGDLYLCLFFLGLTDQTVNL